MKRGVAKSPFRAALTEYMIMLTVAEAAWMDSTPNKRKETNINSGVVEYNSFPALRARAVGCSSVDYV